MRTRDLPDPWPTILEAWALASRRDGLSPRTLEGRAGALRKYAAHHRDPWAVTPDALAAWLAEPERWRGTAPRLMRSTLHTFYAWALAAGHTGSNPAPVRGRVRRDLPPAWADALEAWSGADLARGAHRATVTKHVRHVTLYATTDAPAEVWDVTAEHLARWFRDQDWTPTTATTVRASLRLFFAWALRTGLVATDPAEYLASITAPGAPRPLGARGPLPAHVPDAWSGPLRLYSRHLYAQGRSPQTVGLRVAHLARIARDLRALEPWAVTFDDLADWMAAQHFAPSTRISVRQSLRGFYAWAVLAGHLDTDPAADLPKVRAPEPNPHPASETALRVALLTADPRERLMVRLAAEVGMRRGEIAQVHSRDLLERDGGWSLIVHGKGSRQRLVPLPATLAAVLHSLEPGWAFPSPTAPSGHLSPAYVGKLLSRLLPPGVSPHALRHRFATRAYELEHDIFAVQRLLGHARPETTQRYVASPEASLRSMVDRLSAWTDGANAPAHL